MQLVPSSQSIPYHPLSECMAAPNSHHNCYDALFPDDILTDLKDG